MTTAKQGKNLEDIQKMNRTLVINLLLKQPISTRVDLAKTTGLKPATITNIINDLMACGLVKETGGINGGLGRRSIGLVFNGEAYRVIHVRLARRYFLVGLFDLVWKQYNFVQEDIDILSDPARVMERIKARIHEMLQKAGTVRVVGIGIALPGPYFRTDGHIGPITEFPGWEGTAIENDISKTFGLPTYTEQDANVGALAEWRNESSMINSGTIIYIAAGQGIGAGIVINGKLFTGSLGVAGEIGHTSIAFDGPKCNCGNTGCLELYCSTIALLKEAHKRSAEVPDTLLSPDCSLNQFFHALNLGDKLAGEIFGKVARFLGIGIVNAINVYNPDLIVIGDELALGGGQHLLQIVSQVVKERVLPHIYERLTIRLSTFTEDPAFIGSGLMLLDNINDIILND
jgi:predicted NBD/HSP70 family sugar kinase